MAKGNLNKKKLALGVVGAGFTATGWGLYASQGPDKSLELQEEIQSLEENIEQLESVVQKDNTTIDTLNGIIVESIKNPSLIVEQKMEIDSLNEKVEKLQKTIDGYEDLLLYIEQGNINHPFVKDSLDWFLQNAKTELQKRIKAVEVSTDHQEADRMTEQWIDKLEAQVATQLKIIDQLKDKNKELEAYTGELETYKDAIEDYIDKQVNWEIQSRDEMIDYKNKVTEGLKEELQEKEALIENKDSLIIRLWKDIDELLNQVKHLERTESNLQKYIDELEKSNDTFDFLNKALEKDNKELEQQVEQLRQVNET